MAFANAQKGWFSTGNTGSLACTDDGATWVFQACPTTDALRSISFVGDQIGWVVGYEGIILKTTTGGE